MGALQSHFEVATPGRGFTDITAAVAARVADGGAGSGIVHVFVPHTSCSLLLGENADPAVRDDLERWFMRAVADGDPAFRHTAEGPDDMPAHIRSILAGVSVTAPMRDGQLQLGTWQAIYLWEHRLRATPAHGGGHRAGRTARRALSGGRPPRRIRRRAPAGCRGPAGAR